VILPIPTHFPFVCRLSHSRTLLKPFDGFRCHFAWSNDTLCWMWSLSQGGKFRTKPRPTFAIDYLWCTSEHHWLAIPRLTELLRSSLVLGLVVAITFSFCSQHWVPAQMWMNKVKYRYIIRLKECLSSPSMHLAYSLITWSNKFSNLVTVHI